MKKTKSKKDTVTKKIEVTQESLQEDLRSIGLLSTYLENEDLELWYRLGYDFYILLPIDKTDIETFDFHFGENLKNFKEFLKTSISYKKDSLLRIKINRKYGIEYNKRSPKGAGRPPIDRDVVLEKIKPFLQRGASIRESCKRAKVAYDTVLDWKVKDPEFASKLEYWDSYFLFSCENVIATEIQDKKNAELALKILERRNKNKYSLRTELTGADGEDLYGEFKKIKDWLETPEKKESEQKKSNSN